MQEVMNVDGTINFDALHFRFEHVAPQYLGRRVAIQIAGTTNLKSFDKETRKLLGRQVASLIEEYGFETLTLFTNQMEIEQKYDK